MKNGILSTEFWGMAAQVLVGILVVAGVIRPEAQGDVTNAIVMIVGALLSIVPSISYMIARTYLKSKTPLK